MDIHNDVYNYPVKHKQGFTDSEMDDLLKKYPNINMGKFLRALTGNTCMIIDGEIVNYHCDVEKAIRCGVENRELRHDEFD